MAYIDEQLLFFKEMIEESIIEGGARGKESMIRSSQLINLIHDAVKYELQAHGVAPNQIYPHFGETKPEIKLAGFLKQKDQDVCVVPRGIRQQPLIIDWGPMAFQRKRDPYGFEFSDNSLVINVRSQMSSLAKNSDTLFERTFAEAQNLHMRYPDIVLGEVYLIPVNEYDDAEVANHRVAFKNNITDVEKYISFFDSINGRERDGAAYMYERCTLLVVDFSRRQPRLFRNSAELKEAGIISRNFQIEYATLGFDTFVEDILNVYASRYDINNILR
ncbi:MAG: hypothetical protein ACLUDP_21180 [[Clostridium] innocuum]